MSLRNSAVSRLVPPYRRRGPSGRNRPPAGGSARRKSRGDPSLTRYRPSPPPAGLYNRPRSELLPRGVRAPSAGPSSAAWVYLVSQRGRGRGGPDSLSLGRAEKNSATWYSKSGRMPLPASTSSSVRTRWNSLGRYTVTVPVKRIDDPHQRDSPPEVLSMRTFVWLNRSDGDRTSTTSVGNPGNAGDSSGQSPDPPGST